MFDWIKGLNKEYPQFWKDYLEKFNSKSNRYVIFSTETSGLNPKKDVILSMAAIAVIDDKIFVADSFEVAILQYKYLHDNQLSNEFLIESKLPKLSELQAIQSFVEYIGNATLIGHRINFDIELINEALEKIECGRLKNEALDIEIMHQRLLDITDKQFSIDELATIYKLPSSDRISVSDDTYSIALLFLKLKSKLNIK